MKDIARRALLLDFYGTLLTDKQREIYDWYYQQDLSLGEISEVAGVSRNAVHDLLNRTDNKLERFEKLLGLITARENQEAQADDLDRTFENWFAQYGNDLTPPAQESLRKLMNQVLDMRDNIWHLKV